MLLSRAISDGTKLTEKQFKNIRKSGITLVSWNNGFQYETRNKSNMQNMSNMQNNVTRRPMRSLSVERIRRKKQRAGKYNDFVSSPTKPDMKEITNLQMQYGQLKLKRSLNTQRQASRSGKKYKINTLVNKSEPQGLPLFDKFVPKSKISLNLLSQFYVESQIYQNDLQMTQSFVSSNISNLQVIPIGLNLHRIKNKQNQTCFSNHLTKSFLHKRGIQVISTQNKNLNSGLSLSSSVTGLGLSSTLPG